MVINIIGYRAVFCDLEKCLENDFHVTEIFFMGTNTFEHAEFKSENFPHRIDPQFSHKLLFYLR